MTIQPISNRPREINVVEAVEPAYERVKRMLFSPFDLGRWITIAFCAWLAGFGESGGGANFSSFNHGHQTSGPQAAEQFRHFYHQASDYFFLNIYWLLPLAIFAFVLSIGLTVLLFWLGSRGKFMFLHCVAHNEAAVEAPWQSYADQANSLFLFRLVISLLGFVVILPLAIIIGISAIHMLLSGQAEVQALLVMAGCVLLILPIAFVLGLIHHFTNHFVVPIQYLRRCSCLAAWREFWRLLMAHPGQFALYVLFQIALHMAIGALTVAAILITCCTLGCLLAIPFVGTALLLPVRIFERAYSLYYLAQFGPQYDVFPQPPPPPSPTVPPVSPLAPVAP